MRSVKISDYMARKLVCFRAETNVYEAMQELLDNRISGAPVVNEAGELVGIISEVDLMQVITRGSYYDDMGGIVGDYMHFPVDTVPMDLDIYSLAEKFIHEGRRRFPVLNQGKLVGQISRRNVLEAIRQALAEKRPKR